MAIKDVKLPEAILAGEVGLVFPEYETFAPEDNFDVEVVGGAEPRGVVEDGGVHSHAPPAAKQGGVQKRTPPTVEQGGVQKHAESTPVHRVNEGKTVHTQHNQTNESAEDEQYSEDEMFMADVEPVEVERAQPVPDTERVLETRTSSRVRKQKVKFNDESLVINDNGKRKLPKRVGTHSANPKRTSMTARQLLASTKVPVPTALLATRASAHPAMVVRTATS